MVKQLGRWRSDLLAQGYIEESEYNRQLIFDGITHNTSKFSNVVHLMPVAPLNDYPSIPSTSTAKFVVIPAAHPSIPSTSAANIISVVNNNQHSKPTMSSTNDTYLTTNSNVKDPAQNQ